MKKTLTAVAVVAALSLSACGGGGDRPSKGDLSKEFSKKDNVFGLKLTKKQADCIAEAIVDSKLSDKAVKALKEQDEDFKPTKADNKARDAIAGDVEKCAKP
ncbi:hypothetical protein [Aeromicrobium sp. 9AM]|uniref:hypothetical protein n=1 Tax=Aeromicrobium sp. 9AM TaxID=2653126 RepID=UPI0012F2BE70|nr:hypothetical protein [Aeromicrobium sp. 9AM]VXB24506.1 conserved exported hypothetical protein [Aeromicrobium sp. 9AM]